ncbi:MAG: serine protease [bacterium]|nr:serine protease [bacterium]MDE0289870.1 serine protease [bacterium]MDE0436820.1 serine protease [bacterium]
MEGMFISVIVSVTSEAEARAALADLEGRFDGEFGILRSDDFASLNAGYWVVYAGPFATAAESQNACWSDFGMRTGSLCYGRRLSQSPDDAEVVYPPAPAGRTSTPTVTTGPGEESSAEEVYERVAPSLAHIVNGGRTGAGSGILIDGGYIITNYHVVEPYNTVARVMFPDGTEFRNVPVVGWEPWADFALLGPVDVPIPPLTLKDHGPVASGSELFLLGYPAEPDLYDPQPSITRGVLSRSYRESTTGLTVLRTDAATAGGQSGGAMVDALGKVVGVTMQVVLFRGTGQPVFTEAYSAVDYRALADRIIGAPGPAPDGRTHTPDEPGTEPGYPALLEGKFVSVVVSATSEADAEESREELERRFGMRFGILVSSDFASLNAGYWVVYAGPFVTAAEAQDTCWSILGMRTGSLCYGRRLSQDPADREVVYPPAPG